MFVERLWPTVNQVVLSSTSEDDRSKSLAKNVHNVDILDNEFELFDLVYVAPKQP